MVEVREGAHDVQPGFYEGDNALQLSSTHIGANRVL